MSQININLRCIMDNDWKYQLRSQTIYEYEDDYTGLSSNRILSELDIGDFHHHGLPDHPETELMPIFKYIQPVLYTSIAIIIGIILYSIIGKIT